MPLLVLYCALTIIVIINNSYFNKNIVLQLPECDNNKGYVVGRATVQLRRRLALFFNVQYIFCWDGVLSLY